MLGTFIVLVCISLYFVVMCTCVACACALCCTSDERASSCSKEPTPRRMLGTDEPIPEGDDRPACVVCMMRAPKVAPVDCGHFNYCFACSIKLKQCSVCRTPIAGFVEIFR